MANVPPAPSTGIRRFTTGIERCRVRPAAQPRQSQATMRSAAQPVAVGIRGARHARVRRLSVSSRAAAATMAAGSWPTSSSVPAPAPRDARSLRASPGPAFPGVGASSCKPPESVRTNVQRSPRRPSARSRSDRPAPPPTCRREPRARPAHVRRRMDRPVDLRPRGQRCDLAHRFAHLAHVRVILAAVRGDENDRPRRVESLQRGGGGRSLALPPSRERVDDGVAGDDDVGASTFSRSRCSRASGVGAK